ncbi:MAG: PRC-barrel domain-containing protein [Candidatus Aenigmatarchaeota archaeon]
MAITVKKATEMFGKDVFTNRGAYCGRISDLKVNMEKFRLQSLVLDVAKGSFLSGLIGGKKGIIVPYQYVDSVGDVVIIKHISAPAAEEPEEKVEM